LMAGDVDTSNDHAASVPGFGVVAQAPSGAVGLSQ
jgi:hypothetical protein